MTNAIASKSAMKQKTTLNQNNNDAFQLKIEDIKICVIGLGYVGLPLARLFSTKFPTIGFDINPHRIEELKAGHDARLEVSDEMLKEALTVYGLECTCDIEDIKGCNFYVIAVPTPIDTDNRPDLSPLLGASDIVGKVLTEGNIVVYESTVYPGVTEDKCVPALERMSGMRLNEGFFCGYSPERINPGDKLHTVETIRKVTSGSTPKTADFIDNVYKSVLINGTHKAPSIKVAEASKVIENAQRDVNIAFLNEVAKIFNALGIDTQEVIEAASSKWNFVRLKPGLVGGHCISVDPYYLIQKAEDCDINPELLISARATNEGMGQYVAHKTIDLMNKKGILVKDAYVLILGFTFKENCPDVRNTKVASVVNTFLEYTENVKVVDPWADVSSAKKEYGINVESYHQDELAGKFDAVVLTVAHKDFKNLQVRKFLKNPSKGVVYDVKGVLPINSIDGRL